MLTQTHYLIRFLRDGQYLVARPHQGPETKGYLLLFQEHSEALSYLNIHGGNLTSQFGVEMIAGNQLKGVLERWGFQGIGLVTDPLIPQIQFLQL